MLRNDFCCKAVYITYPYAKLVSERLTLLNKGMTRLSSEKKEVFQDSGKLLK
jgi:hypothetical protein